MIPLIAIVACVGLYYAMPLFSKQKNKTEQIGEGDTGKLYYSFGSLPGDTAAQSGKYTLTNKEVEHSAAMRTFRNKRRDVLFILIYKQFVSFNETPVKKLEFSFKKVSRSPSSLLNQYGIPLKNKTLVEFSKFDEEDGLAKVDGQIVTEDQVDKNNFIWGSFATEIFRFKLASIDKKMKNKIMEAEAEKLNIPVSQYKEKYIYSKLPTEITENDVNQYLKEFKQDDTERNRKAAKNRLLEKRRKRGEAYILEKYVMSLPIQVNLTPPQFSLETKNEYTPAWTKGSGQVKIDLFSDTRMDASQALLKGLFPLIEKYKDLTVTYRPVFFETDKLQEMTSIAQFCAWMEDKGSFWEYLKISVGDFATNTELKLNDIAKQTGFDSSAFRKCVIEKKSKEIVDYHRKYANYIGIFAGPVLYVDGEVLHGNISIEDVENIIQRKLEIPTAGLWKK